jgi:hypothetical protein
MGLREVVGCVILLGGAAALGKVLLRDGGVDRGVVTFMIEGAPSIWQLEVWPNTHLWPHLLTLPS